MYKRPYVHEFIAAANNLCDLAVWTAADQFYANAVIAELFPSNSLEFVLSRQHCTLSINWETREDEWIKNIKRITRKGYDLKSILAVDDSPSGYAKSYGNLIAVREFLGDPKDDELILLSEFLKQIADAPNVRSIEKRNWRLKLEGRSVNPEKLP